MTKKVTCLFLGSGASYALAGVPIQGEFLRSVLAPERTQWIDECEEVNHRITVNGHPISSWMMNIEDVELAMSHLHNMAYYEELPKDSLPPSNRRHAVRAIINLRTAIAEHLHRRKMDLEQRICVQFVDWLSQLSTDTSSLLILSTNYDLVLEKLLSNPQRYHYPELTTASNNGPKTIQLYKLHGSINWLEARWFDDNEIRSHPKPQVVIHDNLLSIAEKQGDWAYLFQSRDLYSPVLVTFFYQKEVWLAHGRWENLFQKHWDSARETLENGLSKIYFIGYSLPPADHYMLTWLLSILNSTKPDITIVRKGADKPTTLEKALKPFRPKVYECGFEDFLDGHV